VMRNTLFWFPMIFAIAAAAHAGPEAGITEKTMKAGILLVAFGSTAPQTLETYDRIEKRVRASFPDTTIRWAYTSPTVRKKWAERGKTLDSAETALAGMSTEGFTHLSVLSLHVIAGKEFHSLYKTVQAFSGSTPMEIRIGLPLLAEQKETARISAAVLSTLPPERKPEDAVVLMGHGSAHPANAAYAALMFEIQRKDPMVFVGCVAGYPELPDIQALLKEKKVRKAYLVPFMAVAGEHALRDMAGDEEGSWKVTLQKAGIQCVPVLKGMADHDAFVDIWVEHLKNAGKL
jgi:sirohydrochlorin cobaltochelatase